MTFSLKAKKYFARLALLPLALLCYHFLSLKDPLDRANLTSSLSDKAEWEVASLTDREQHQVEEILKQPFFYLSEGGQSIVFASEDQQYVLKFFKFNRFRPTPLVRILPSFFPFQSYRQKHTNKREQKLNAAFKGHKLAYDLIRKESGLLFVQLNPWKSSCLVTLIDKKGTKRILNLQGVSFILQKKGEMLSADFSQILDRGDIQLAKERIEQLLDLYLLEYSKGIYDLDHGIMHNMGILEGRLFHLDVGKLSQNEQIKKPAIYVQDLVKVVVKLNRWIERHHPIYAVELRTYMEEAVSNRIGSIP